MKYTPRHPKSNVNVSSASPLKEFFLLTVGLLVIVLGGYVLLGFMVDIIVPHISIETEKRMASLLIQSIHKGKADSEQELYVQSLIDKTEQDCIDLPYQFEVHVRKGGAINALALPGGHIVVYTGLLEQAHSENELTFILAHEMGHYAHRDHLRGLGRAMVFMTISTFLLGTDSGVSRMLAQGLNITEMTFSRNQETRADEFALETVNCVYGHVGGATDFFEKIPKEQDPGKFGHYFSSHPENRRRISHLVDIIRSKQFKRAEKTPLPEGIQRKKKNQ
jgi:predicted Zn-dependent protease